MTAPVEVLVFAMLDLFDDGPTVICWGLSADGVTRTVHDTDDGEVEA